MITKWMIVPGFNNKHRVDVDKLWLSCAHLILDLACFIPGFVWLIFVLKFDFQYNILRSWNMRRSSANISGKQCFLSLYIYTFWCLFTLISGCRIMHGTNPFTDDNCVSNTLYSLQIWHCTGLLQCQLRCLKMEHCHFLNYNASSGQCELGFSRCVSLWLARRVWGNAYGSSRHVCLHWQSDQPAGLIPVEIHDGAGYLRIARSSGRLWLLENYWLILIGFMPTMRTG